MADRVLTTLDGFSGHTMLRREFSGPVYKKRELGSISRSVVITDIAPGHFKINRKLTALDLDAMRRPNHPLTSEHNHTSIQKIAKPITNNLENDQLKLNKINPNKGHHWRKPKPNTSYFHNLKQNKLQYSLVSLAIIMIVVGGYTSLSAWNINHVAQAAAIKLTSQANKAAAYQSVFTTPTSNQVLTTTKPAPAVVAAYAVAPNYPKYLKIPAIGVDSIVGQVGLLASGALGTPSNVFYTDWYTGSAEPGQPGATLIDGHVSSWTAHGVFYNLHNLVPGDSIQIIKGNNQVVNYVVVKTQVYPSTNVNMQAAITPIDPNASGLNLITCTGQVIAGTSQFNERVIVFAKEVS